MRAARPRSQPRFPGRKLGLENARTHPDDAHCTHCMAIIAASNLQVGERVRRGVVTAIQKTLTLEQRGERRRWSPDTGAWPQLIRDLADEVLHDTEVFRSDGSKSDLLHALERDPAFRWVAGVPELNDDFPRLRQVNEPPVPFFKILAPSPPPTEAQWPAGTLWNP